uniref:Uncharacterized protein n=1 Tax=Rhizophora mucronata TaxID=61149 RepID=A0A2P2NX08_RHIMU
MTFIDSPCVIQLLLLSG